MCGKSLRQKGGETEEEETCGLKRLNGGTSMPSWLKAIV